MSTTLWNVWEETVARDPEAEAAVCAHHGTRRTRASITLAAKHFAKLAPPEAQPGEIVAFALSNETEWLGYFLALQALGLVALPLDPALPVEQQARVATELGAHWMPGDRLLPPWRRLPTQYPPLEGDFCLLKTTSGSTGQPRALAFTSANMLADGRQIIASMEIRPEDRNLGAIPLGHSYGLGNLVLPLILQGTVIIQSREILPDGIARQVEWFGATVLPSVPAVLRVLAATSNDPGRMRTLRKVISAGAPLRPEVARDFHGKFGLPIQNFYGSSETGGICFDRTGEATLTGRSVGTPLDGVRVDLDEGGRVTVCSGAVVAHGKYTLTDLGAWTSKGELALTGRAMALANIGGKKVSPLEVERTLRDLEGVTDAWVGVQARATGGGDFLLAAVETERSIQDIRHALVERLPLWQVPRHLWITSHLPRTARGKLDRQDMEAHCLGLA